MWNGSRGRARSTVIGLIRSLNNRRSVRVRSRRATLVYEHRGVILSSRLQITGPIYALATTESVRVPVDAVLWLDDESYA